MSARALAKLDVAAATLLVALIWPASVRGVELMPVGNEVAVNSYTTGAQVTPQLTADQAGRSVVVWTSAGSAGSDTSLESIQAQRYDAAAAAIGAQFQVNSYTTGLQYFPAVAAGPDGKFIVVWASNGSGESDTSGISVHARRYDAAGTPLGDQFQVNTYTTGAQGHPWVAVDASGSSVVVWDNGPGGATSVRGRRFDAGGSPLADDFEIDPAGRLPHVAFQSGGGFVVAWDRLAGFPTFHDVHGRRYDSSGTPTGAVFQVNTYTSGSQGVPAIASDALGNFVVAWHSFGSAGTDSDQSSIQARRYDASGTPSGPEFQVNTYTPGYQAGASLACHADGSFIITWTHQFFVDDSEVRARRYDAAGTALGSEFQVNSLGLGYQINASVAVDAAGNYHVAWQSDDTAGGDTSVTGIERQGYASSYPILGKKFLVKDPTGNDDQRVVVVLAKEAPTDIGPTVLGDPRLTGASVRIVASGVSPVTATDFVYPLSPSGWSAAGTGGYKYRGPAPEDAGSPVKKVLIKRTSSGRALVKAILKGNANALSALSVVPPVNGDYGGLVLRINGGGSYCALFGGAAGGTEVRDDAQMFKIINPVSDVCPPP